MRLRRLAEERMSSDHEVIQKKMEEHQEEYQTMRQKRLERGLRAGSMYRIDRKKEAIESHTGPELAIVVKGLCLLP